MGKVKLDEIDHQILDMLIDNTRTPFTDIAKKLLISAGTVHVRVKKMEEAGIIRGSSLTLGLCETWLFLYCLCWNFPGENTSNQVCPGTSCSKFPMLLWHISPRVNSIFFVRSGPKIPTMPRISYLR